LAREAFPALATDAGADAPPVTLTPERAALLHAALDGDLKTQLLALASDTDAATTVAEPAALGAVLAGALTAITAVQLNAAAALQTSPDGLAFTLPVALPDGFARAHVRIDPDASAAKRGSLDGDNFHIAFILETRHLGTVAIELVTVGRAVTLSVKTEARPAQRVMGGKLGDLTARLESLRYRVAKADAVVATPPAAPDPSVPTAAAATSSDATHLVDFDA
jgi:hypothetical protein